MVRSIAFFARAGTFLTLVSVAASGQVTGSVFADRNANGRRDAGEPGMARVAISNQIEVVATDTDGQFTLPSRGTGVVFVSMPEGYRVVGKFWQRADSSPAVFALVPAASDGELTFIHASDTHIQPSAVVRMDRLRAIADSVRPAFVLITGDLTRDALRVAEPEARGYYELFARESARMSPPVWTVPGNHELFGIERHLSLVSPSGRHYAAYAEAVGFDGSGARFRAADPEPGSWRVMVRGMRGGGERVEFRVTAEVAAPPGKQKGRPAWSRALAAPNG